MVVRIFRQVSARWASAPAWQRNFVFACTLLGVWAFGWQGFVIPAAFFWFTGRVVLDADVMRWYRLIQSQYSDTVADDSDTDWSPDKNIQPTRRSATKFALLAQAKVGMLKPTVANRLVYETILLRLFDEYHVRHNVRIAMLGDALVACFLRPKEYEYALKVVEALESADSGDGPPL